MGDRTSTDKSHPQFDYDPYAEAHRAWALEEIRRYHARTDSPRRAVDGDIFLPPEDLAELVLTYLDFVKSYGWDAAYTFGRGEWHARLRTAAGG